MYLRKRKSRENFRVNVMIRRIIDAHNYSPSIVAPLQRAQHQDAGFDGDERSARGQFSIMLIRHDHPCGDRRVESLGFAQYQSVVRLPGAAMGYQRVIELVMAEALRLRRLLHWSGVSVTCGQVAAREPFHTAQ